MGPRLPQRLWSAPARVHRLRWGRPAPGPVRNEAIRMWLPGMSSAVTSLGGGPSDGDEEADVIREIMAVTAVRGAYDTEVHSWLGRDQPPALDELPLGAPVWDEFTGKALPEADVRASRAEEMALMTELAVWEVVKRSVATQAG